MEWNRMPMKGIDEDWAKADPVQAATLGFLFIVGYVSQDTTGKNITLSDVQRIHAAGLDLGLVYEYNPQSALGGRVQGVTDANIAISHAKGLGAPSGTALYAAVDWNVGSDQMATVLEYALGFLATCLNAGFRSGIYGSFSVVAYLALHGYAGFLWQTYAWSAGVWYQKADLRQTQNGVHVAGATVDIDESETLDWGQWKAVSTTDIVVWNTGFMLQGILQEDDPIVVPVNTAIGAPGFSIPNLPKQRMVAIQTALSGLNTNGLTDADRTTLDACTTAVQALDSRLASP
jgi:Domain of unknown function (DUF1906)